MLPFLCPLALPLVSNRLCCSIIFVPVISGSSFFVARSRCPDGCAARRDAPIYVLRLRVHSSYYLSFADCPAQLFGPSMLPHLDVHLYHASSQTVFGLPSLRLVRSSFSYSRELFWPGGLTVQCSITDGLTPLSYISTFAHSARRSWGNGLDRCSQFQQCAARFRTGSTARVNTTARQGSFLAPFFSPSTPTNEHRF